MKFYRFAILSSFVCLASFIQAQLFSFPLNETTNETDNHKSLTFTEIDILTEESEDESQFLADYDDYDDNNTTNEDSENLPSPSEIENRFSFDMRTNIVKHCGDFFIYRGTLGSTDTYGLISIPKPDRNKNTIRIIMTVAQRLNTVSNYFISLNTKEYMAQFIFHTKNDRGELTLYKSREETYDDVLNGRSLQLRMRFPVQNPISKIHQIYLNEKLMCSTKKGEIVF